MNYIVVSFDYNNTSLVSLHCVVEDKETAHYVYVSTINEYPGRLVKFVGILKPFLNIVGFALLREEICPGVVLIKSNNQETETPEHIVIDIE